MDQVDPGKPSSECPTVQLKQITNTGDLLLVLKSCEESAIFFFGWADNRRMVLKCTTDLTNNTPQFLNSEFPSRLVALPRLNS